VNKFTKKFLFFLSFVVILYSSTNFVHAKILFKEDFSKKNLDNWTFIRNNCSTPDLSSEKLVFDVNNYNCNAELVPNNFYLGLNENNYVYESDIYVNYPFVFDGKFIFKYKDPNNYYWVQIFENGVYINKTVNGNGVGLTNWHPSFPKSPNNIYRFRVEYKTINEIRTINLYVNGYPVAINVEDSPPYIENSNIAIGVSTGGWPLLYTWFDNIVVTDLGETEPTSIPVVFIPGLGGSFSFKGLFLNQDSADDWIMTPGANVYKNIQEEFGNNLHLFLYDWRKPTIDNAQKLNNFIKDIVKPEGGKVNLIGHCLGGLVARTCVQTSENNCYVENLITISTPHLGVVDVYPIIEGGQIWRKGIYKLALETLIHYHKKPMETKKDTILRLTPSLYDLLPQFDYIYKNGAILSWPQISVKNSLLPHLSNISLLENKLSNIYGVGYNTISSLKVINPSRLETTLGYWTDGKPIEKYVSPEGDRTVLSLSSSFDEEGVDNFQFNLDHNGIISQKEVINKILEILDNNLKDKNYQGLNEEENYLVIFVHSPVEISIEGLSEYNVLGNELIILPNPENNIYTLEVKGLENSLYQLSIGQIYGESVLWNDYKLETEKDKENKYEIYINTTKPQDNPLLKNENYLKNHNIHLLTTLEELKEKVNLLDVKPQEKKKITNFINRTKESINSPKKAILYSSLARKQTLSKQIVSLTNEDKLKEIIDQYLELHNLLEILLLDEKSKCSKQKSKELINETDNIKNDFSEIIDVRIAGLIFFEAEEKLNRAIVNFDYGNYCEAEVYAKSAREIFLDSKRINNFLK
jgi:pimeloyl-ACP methyl ester carboxylesterase